MFVDCQYVVRKSIYGLILVSHLGKKCPNRVSKTPRHARVGKYPTTGCRSTVSVSINLTNLPTPLQFFTPVVADNIIKAVLKKRQSKFTQRIRIYKICKDFNAPLKS